MTTSNLLAQLFPTSVADIPEQYRLAAPIEQRDYLVDGQLQVWNGPLAQVQSPVQLGDRRVVIGSTPLLDADTALTALDAAVRALMIVARVNGRRCAWWSVSSTSRRFCDVCANSATQWSPC